MSGLTFSILASPKTDLREEHKREKKRRRRGEKNKIEGKK
jgi:hypothetical protein